MGSRNYWREGDGRSGRNTRISTVGRRVLRSFPTEPDRSVPPGSIHALSVTNLVDEAHRYVHEERRNGARITGVQVKSDGYGAFMSELVENKYDLGRRRGVYIIHEAGSLQRALYIGSAWLTNFRARLTHHLFPGGSLHGLDRQLFPGLNKLLASRGVRGEADEHRVDREMRRVLFGANRWSARGIPRTSEEKHAVELICIGAFDITFIVIPENERAVAQWLERHLVQACDMQCGQVPPLQSLKVWISRKAILAAAQLGIKVRR